jgi:hypothetical protein
MQFNIFISLIQTINARPVSPPSLSSLLMHPEHSSDSHCVSMQEPDSNKEEEDGTTLWLAKCSSTTRGAGCAGVCARGGRSVRHREHRQQAGEGGAGHPV